MCKCTPEIRTPFCGKSGCEWPKSSVRGHVSVRVEITEPGSGTALIDMMVDPMMLDYCRMSAKEVLRHAADSCVSAAIQEFCNRTGRAPLR